MRHTVIPISCRARHIVTETQRTGDDVLSEAIDILAEKYPTTPAGTAKRTKRRTPEH
jgi:hypothetical protein